MHIQNQNLHKEAPVRRREDDELTAKGKFPSHFPHWNVCGSRPRQRLSRRHSRNPGRLRIRRPVRTPDSNQGIQAQRQHLLGTTRRKPSSVRPTAGGTLEQKRGQQGSGERVTRRWRSSRPRRRGGGGEGMAKSSSDCLTSEEAETQTDAAAGAQSHAGAELSELL